MTDLCTDQGVGREWGHDEGLHRRPRCVPRRRPACHRRRSGPWGPVGHRVERLVVLGSAQNEPRKVDVQLWYPADAASAAARPLTTYSSALNGRQLIPGKAPLTWSIPAELAREGATVAPGPYPVIVFSHGNNNDPIDYAYTLEQIASAGFVVVAPGHTANQQEDVRIDFANAQGASPPVPCNDGPRRRAAASRCRSGWPTACVTSRPSCPRSPAWFGYARTSPAPACSAIRAARSRRSTATGGSDVWPITRRPALPGRRWAWRSGRRPSPAASDWRTSRCRCCWSRGVRCHAPSTVSDFAIGQMSANPDKRLIACRTAFHRTFDSTYCEQVQSSGTIAAANPNAVLDKQTFDQIAFHADVGVRPQNYCRPSTFTLPAVADAHWSPPTASRSTATNVPTLRPRRRHGQAADRGAGRASSSVRSSHARRAGGVAGTVPGDARADARTGGVVRRVHARRGARVHGDDDRERDLHRR